MSMGGRFAGLGFDRLVAEARAGDGRALTTILEAFRPYLLAVANAELADGLRGKVGGSDLVQETFIEAQRDFGGFTGNGPDDLRAWLREILLHNVADQARRFRANGKRDPGREHTGGAALEGVVDPGLTPGTEASRREEDARLAAAIARLPANDQDVIRLRNFDHQTWEETGRLLGRTEEAARKLWSRAVVRLNKELKGGPQ